jgi:hypothetical protein
LPNQWEKCGCRKTDGKRKNSQGQEIQELITNLFRQYYPVSYNSSHSALRG